MVVRAIGILKDVQRLAVEELCSAELAPLGMETCQLVQGPGHDRVVRVHGRLPQLQSSLQGWQCLGNHRDIS